MTNKCRIYSAATAKRIAKHQYCGPIALSYLTGISLTKVVAKIKEIDPKALTPRNGTRLETLKETMYAFGLDAHYESLYSDYGHMIDIVQFIETRSNLFPRRGIISIYSHVLCYSDQKIYDTTTHMPVFYKKHPLRNERVYGILIAKEGLKCHGDTSRNIITTPRQLSP